MFDSDACEYSTIERIKKVHGHRPFWGCGFSYNFSKEPEHIGFNTAIPLYRLNGKDKLVLLGAYIQRMDKYLENEEFFIWNPAHYHFRGIMSPWRYKRLLKEHDPQRYAQLYGQTQKEKNEQKQVISKENDALRQKFVKSLNQLNKIMGPTETRQGAKRKIVALYHQEKDRQGLIALLDAINQTPPTKARKNAKKAAVWTYRKKYPKIKGSR